MGDLLAWVPTLDENPWAFVGIGVAIGLAIMFLVAGVAWTLAQIAILMERWL